MRSHDPSRVLVIGTTADYVEWIRKDRPGMALFVTSRDVRQTAREPTPRAEEEILCDLTDGPSVILALMAHLEAFNLKPVGVVCFDCESMALAALVADHFSMPYPSAESIENCRHKNLSKDLWRKRGVDCPDSMMVNSLDALVGFYNSNSGPVVIKPSNGSGSELVFICDSASECGLHYATLCKELELRVNNRLYSIEINDRPLVVAEAYIEGDEYSCDFLLKGDGIQIIRVAEKIRPSRTPFGTIGGYVLPASLPTQHVAEQLPEALKSAAQAIGLETCIGMADFIVSNGRIFFIEITPRPGGDCLPFLLWCACGLDMLGLAMDVAAGRRVSLPNTGNIRRHMGVRIHARKPGRLKRVEVNRHAAGFGILDVNIIRRPGHRIIMPPADYESWFLGHVIMKLEEGVDPHLEYCHFLEGVLIEVEDETDGDE